MRAVFSILRVRNYSKKNMTVAGMWALVPPGGVRHSTFRRPVIVTRSDRPECLITRE
jgi:hypothetical protein